MRLNRTNIALAGVLVIVVLLTMATRVDYTQPNIEILPDMKYSPAWTAYAQNPVFANGRTLQSPVPGAIARGQMPLHFEATPEDAVRAGEEVANPYHIDTQDDGETDDNAAPKLQDSIRRGGETYRVFCICCHGATGGGDGLVTKRGYPTPPSLLTGKSPQMKDGQLFHVLTYGQGNMPEFTGQLAAERRWDVINYIRSLQTNRDTAVPANEVELVESRGADDETASAETGDEQQQKDQ